MDLLIGLLFVIIIFSIVTTILKSIIVDPKLANLAVAIAGVIALIWIFGGVHFGHIPKYLK